MESFDSKLLIFFSTTLFIQLILCKTLSNFCFKSSNNALCVANTLVDFLKCRVWEYKWYKKRNKRNSTSIVFYDWILNSNQLLNENALLSFLNKSSMCIFCSSLICSQNVPKKIMISIFSKIKAKMLDKNIKPYNQKKNREALFLIKILKSVLWGFLHLSK